MCAFPAVHLITHNVNEIDRSQRDSTFLCPFQYSSLAGAAAAATIKKAVVFDLQNVTKNSRIEIEIQARWLSSPYRKSNKLIP